MTLINNIYKKRFVNKNDKLRFTKLLRSTYGGLFHDIKLEYSKELDRFNLDKLKDNFFKLLYSYLIKFALKEFYSINFKHKICDDKY